MTVKRTRTSNDTELAPSAAAKAPPKLTAEQFQSRIATPSRVQESAPMKLGGFLERCQYCKKRIPEGGEVFMYKDFCAYCSAGCRDIQISLDKLAERQPACSKQKAIQYGEMKDVKNHSGS